MKKVTKIIPIITILVISVLVLLFLDFNEANSYMNLKGFNMETISIKCDDGSNLADIVNNVQEIARKNNVILVKTTVDYKKENGVNVYLSLENIDELNKLLNKKFNVKATNNEITKSSFLSTYNQNSDNQIGIINDLFGDHFYTYYLMDVMIENNYSLFGNYSILYDDFQNYSNFMNEVNNLLGYDTYAIGYYNSIDNYILILIVVSLLLMLLFYFVFQVYDYYNSSKKIGCMKLLGHDGFHINKNLCFKNVKINFISFFSILLLSIIFVKNITPYHLLILSCINLFIILLTYFISYLSCNIINKNYKLVNMLKMENITLEMGKISYGFKTIMTIMLICFTVIVFQNVNTLHNQLKVYNESKNTLEYSVLKSYVAGQQESRENDKIHDLYLKIINNMDTFYASFQDYSQYTSQDFERLEQAERVGKSFHFDSIDKNYLKMKKIKVYDINDEEIDIDKINSVYYLLPKSKKSLIDLFKKFHLELDEYYLKYNKNYSLVVYFYNDQKIDTYQVTSKYIESPILRVVNDSITSHSFLDDLGINFFGQGMGTGLKIKLIDGDKEKTMETLFGYIDESGLSNLFSRQSFMTYKDYFNDEILASRIILLVVTMTIVLILTIYILISFQLLKLYIKAQKKTILVKKMLGFDDDNIFENVYRKNSRNTIISIIIALLILIIIKRINISFVFMPVIFLILDFLVTLISIKSTKLTTIYSDLKGGNYD